MQYLSWHYNISISALSLGNPHYDLKNIDQPPSYTKWNETDFVDLVVLYSNENVKGK